MLKRLWLALFAVAMTCLAPVVLAQASEADKAAARELAKVAAQALDKRQYQVAAEKFLKADQLYHAPTLVVGLARAYVGLGKYVEAKEAYNRVIIEKLPAGASDQFIQAVNDAKKEIVGLDDKMAWGTINIASSEPQLPTGLQATLDDQELKEASFGVRRPLNPGQHKLVITAPGYKEVDRSFDVTPRADIKIDVKLERVAGATSIQPPPNNGTATNNTATNVTATTNAPPADTGGKRGNTQRILGFTSIGLGAAGVIVGAITGGLAISKHGQLKDECPNGSCQGADAQSKIDVYETLGAVSTASFIVGGVFAVTGLVVVLTAPKADSKTGSARAVKIGVGPASVQATLQF